MADNFVDAVKAMKRRLSERDFPKAPPPPDLDTLWAVLSPSLQQALEEREQRIVEYVNDVTRTKK